jgi:hypothetical protein
MSSLIVHSGVRNGDIYMDPSVGMFVSETSNVKALFSRQEEFRQQSKRKDESDLQKDSDCANGRWPRNLRPDVLADACADCKAAESLSLPPG